MNEIIKWSLFLCLAIAAFISRRISVRLGEHKKSRDSDCRPVRWTLTCTPPVENIKVEDFFIHEHFNGKYNSQIAIVKLARGVEFQIVESNTFTVTGWGRTENETSSDVLMETQITQRVPGICHAAFQIDIKSTQLCVGEQGEDSCNGDSGGPLSSVSYFNEAQRFIPFGVESLGSVKCAQVDPGIYTNIGSFMSWIADKIATK